MNDDHHPLDDELDPDELAALEGLLSNDAVWVEPPADLEDAVVAAITAEAATSGVAPPTAAPAPPPMTARPSESTGSTDNVVAFRRRALPVLGAAAAIVLAVFGLTTLFSGGDDGPEGRIVELAGTDLAPGASAEADVVDTPAGVKILLDVSDLPPAPEGGFYQAWVRNADGGVSAGTFHLRGGDGEIELWSGVPIDEYPIITVTLQMEGEGPASSGQVVLRGEISPS
ncbi:MAG: anti-sigma factor [Actinomycetota bacterium]